MALQRQIWNHKYRHGGDYRKKKKGRKARPLSKKHPHHVVFKINKYHLKQLGLRSHQTHKIVKRIIKKYSRHFLIKISHSSIQNDHIHLLIHTSKRSGYQNFFRVVAGQIAQQLWNEDLLINVTDTLRLWLQRPFSRIVFGEKAIKIVLNYIQLNEKEVLGKIKYNKRRLRGLSSADWKVLWS